MDQHGLPFDFSGSEKREKELHRKAQVSFFQQLIEDGITEGNIEDLRDACTVTHHFTPVLPEFDCSIYGRELFMPKGATIVGKLHRHPHLAFLLKGKIIVVSEFGKETLEAPHTFISPRGAKRAFYVLEDAILTTVHLTSEDCAEALLQIEKETIAENYEELGMEEPDLKRFEDTLQSLENFKDERNSEK